MSRPIPARQRRNAATGTKGECGLNGGGSPLSVIFSPSNINFWWTWNGARGNQSPPICPNYELEELDDDRLEAFRGGLLEAAAHPHDHDDCLSASTLGACRGAQTVAKLELMHFTDDLLLHALDFLDVVQAFRLWGSTCRRFRELTREWFPWRCVELRYWVTVPNYRQKLLTMYTDALELQQGLEGNTEIFERRIKVAHFFGQAGLYRQSEALLQHAVDRDVDEGRLADLLHALADVSWKAQQARQGGGLRFLWGIVEAAKRSCELRRRMTGPLQRRRLALTLEILAENAACFGHCMQASWQDAALDLPEDHSWIHKPFELADAAAAECIFLWQDLDDKVKLADAWAASAAVDFYTGNRYEMAMQKLEKAATICTEASGRVHATNALALFNMAYISHRALGNTERAIGLYSESLSIRREVLGPEHPFTVATAKELQECLREVELQSRQFVFEEEALAMSDEQGDAEEYVAMDETETTDAEYDEGS